MPENLTEMTDSDIVAQVTVLDKLNQEMQDPELEEAMAIAIKCIRKPDVPPAAAVDAIVKLQAISAKFAFGSVYYKTFGKSGTQERYRKDVYYTAREAINLLVDSLKYIIRAHEKGSGSRF